MVRLTLCSALAVLGLMACQATESDIPKDTGLHAQAGADGGVSAVSAWTIPDEVRGTVPSTPRGLPEFSGVMNHRGETVSNEALQGHFSVLWFYPLANTSG
ncbi:MAG: hypothetical protein CMH56_11740 [Myxococcales bacterium]|nr:hypothetical protein [Myxococcales bacterium]|tara:strand:+ start:1603 stop:1905 length:303 start_codon:yes stop_codon:yes gene_type:complete